MRAKAITVWLRADLEVLYDRVRRRSHRPLLRQGDPKEVLARLMAQRYPIYAEADIVVDLTAQPADVTTEQVIEALRAILLAARRRCRHERARTVRVSLAGRGYDIADRPGPDRSRRRT